MKGLARLLGFVAVVSASYSIVRALMLAATFLTPRTPPLLSADPDTVPVVGKPYTPPSAAGSLRITLADVAIQVEHLRKQAIALKQQVDSLRGHSPTVASVGSAAPAPTPARATADAPHTVAADPKADTERALAVSLLEHDVQLLRDRVDVTNEALRDRLKTGWRLKAVHDSSF
jgi:hypothetical protein